MEELISVRGKWAHHTYLRPGHMVCFVLPPLSCGKQGRSSPHAPSLVPALPLRGQHRVGPKRSLARTWCTRPRQDARRLGVTCAKPPAQRLAQQERHKRRVKMALLGGSSG